MLAKPDPQFQHYRCVTPGFDNSPRRAKDSVIFADSSPHAYGNWLAQTVSRTRRRFNNPEEQIVFINAWNEWGEGNHLEPDLKWGRRYLEETKKALDQNDGG
jgi:hypothetical protein